MQHSSVIRHLGRPILALRDNLSDRCSSLIWHMLYKKTTHAICVYPAFSDNVTSYFRAAQANSGLVRVVCCNLPKPLAFLVLNHLPVVFTTHSNFFPLKLAEGTVPASLSGLRVCKWKCVSDQGPRDGACSSTQKPRQLCAVLWRCFQPSDDRALVSEAAALFITTAMLCQLLSALSWAHVQEMMSRHFQIHLCFFPLCVLFHQQYQQLSAEDNNRFSVFNKCIGIHVHIPPHPVLDNNVKCSKTMKNCTL